MVGIIISKSIAAIVLVVSSFMIIKRVLQEDKVQMNLKNILLLIAFGVITVFVHNTNYSPLASLIIFASMILVYKFVFNIEISKSIVAVGVMFILYFISDILIWIILSIIFKSELIRTNVILIVISNFLVSGLSIAISTLPYIQIRLNKFVNKVDANKYYDKILFFILMFVVLTLMLYNISMASLLSKKYLINVIIMVFFFVLTYIYVNEKLKKEKLDDENNRLLEYVEHFNTWIEDEQLNRHEYKNQLAVIRSMASSNKRILKYIDDILKDDVYVEDFWVNEIKNLPTGGIKGLLYYKLILTKKENINVCLSISHDIKGRLLDINNSDLKDISRLLGIYLDNAIEAAKESLNKIISIEIYAIQSKLIIVISNTYSGKVKLQEVNKKGYTTKGSGHGKGLYFANKIIKKSPVLTSENSIINNYYVQKLIIRK